MFAEDSASWGGLKIPYYFVKPSGRAYWRLTGKAMRLRGFHLVPLGDDGPAAWRWLRNGIGNGRQFAEAKRPRSLICRSSRPMKRKRRDGIHRVSMGAAFNDTSEPTNGPHVRLGSQTRFGGQPGFVLGYVGSRGPGLDLFEMISRWRAALKKSMVAASLTKTIRVWRAFWNIMLATQGGPHRRSVIRVRNRAPAPRWQRWSEGEAVLLVKAAWRRLPGPRMHHCRFLDTQFSPVDVRTLADRHRSDH